ncbi:TRAP transporter substrate-binding protein DctP [Roseovarius sp. SK2]|uniref:TRAP transporter substrate-binding protein DctP n=1 Tax=Roseovarius TaxID=74030 RepID=UPI00237BE988|nr:TRAP transporter substrate-binding protein DctP [Roseovarius sp. SK2]MDD9725990.1 TRAP transporter substrate-binding protein DctP [Roseovarius sp. SK2]
MSPLKKGIATVALAASMTGALMSSAALAAEHEWKMATTVTGGPLMELGAEAFAERVSQMTEGRVEIEVFPAGTLGKALDVSTTVKRGVAEVGHTWMGYDWGKDKTTVLFGGFAGSMDSERMLHWLYQGGGQELWTEFRQDRFGIVSMPLFMRPAEVFLHSKKPVSTLEDLQGLKMRTAGAWLEISSELGASPVTMAGGEVYTSLERGTIDATEWGSLYENVSPGFYQIAKYVVVPGVHQPVAPYELVINDAAWEALSEQDQEMVRLAAELVTFESWMRLGNEDAKALEFYRDNGNEIIVLEDEVKDAAKRLGMEWADRQAEGNEWFERVLASQREFESTWSEADSYRKMALPPQDGSSN